MDPDACLREYWSAVEAMSVEHGTGDSLEVLENLLRAGVIHADDIICAMSDIDHKEPAT